MTTRNMAEIRAMWVEQGQAEERNRMIGVLQSELDEMEGTDPGLMSNREQGWVAAFRQAIALIEGDNDDD